MEKVDEIVSVNFYVKDMFFYKDITIEDLKNIDRLILVFARHAFRKENKIFSVENQFEARLDEELLTLAPICKGY